MPCIAPFPLTPGNPDSNPARKLGRGLVFASSMAVGMNWGWICFTALCVIFAMMGV